MCSCWDQDQFVGQSRSTTLALSSVEEKYHNAMNVVIQAILLHGILTKFSIHTSPSVEILCDNQSAIKISSDPVQKQ